MSYFMLIVVIYVIMFYIGCWNSSWNFDSSNLWSTGWTDNCLCLQLAGHSADLIGSTSDNGNTDITD